MDVICVDDEIMALKLLILNCNKIEEIDTVQGFSTSAEALEYAKSHKFDVAFCDIDMPYMNGIELATKMRKLNPNLNVVLTTAYSEYALDAFNNDCSGYIMKPISVNKIKHQLSVLRFKQGQNTPNGEKPVHIQCFGYFQVFIHNKPPKFTYTKTLELLAILVDAKGGLITNRQISCFLWEDGEHTEYFKKLRADLLNTFADAGCNDVLHISKGSIGINKALVDCDYYNYLSGTHTAAYTGEYMYQYSWAEETNALLFKEMKHHV